MRDPYDTLGMPAGSSPEALQARYEELKKKYSEQRFKEGSAGYEGARRLSELEADWKLIQQDIKREQDKATFGGEYGKVEHAVKEGNYDAAQAALDEITNHDAKWHYYQSIIFYKRDWLSESRAQLMLAIQLDPTNMKYQDALRKMDTVMGNAGVNPQDVGGRQQGPYTDPNAQYAQQQQADSTANACANCVLCYCLTETCCNVCRFC